MMMNTSSIDTVSLLLHGERESSATNTEIEIDRWERTLKELATIELKGYIDC